MTANTAAAVLTGLVLVSTPAWALHPRLRSLEVHHAFRAGVPCPSTGETEGPCPGYVVDHFVPLCLGGPDAVANMWFENEVRSAVKDRIERHACQDMRRVERTGN